MATPTSEQKTLQPPEIRARLGHLRSAIRSYVWIEGIAAAIAWLAASFWVTLVIDWFFEPPPAGRIIMMSASLIGLLYIIYALIIRRAFVRFSDANMAMILERRYPELGDSLLTVVAHLDHDVTDDQLALRLHQQMLDNTLEVAAQKIHEVRVLPVFRMWPLVRLMLAVMVLIGAIVFYVNTNPISAGIWLQRNVLLSNEEWPRRTQLTMEGFEDGVERVAAGSDLRIVALVDTINSTEVPSSIDVEYTTAAGRHGSGSMNRVVEANDENPQFQKYEYTFRGVMAPIEFDLYGGDDRILDLKIEVVANPTLEDIRLRLTYPEYTGIKSRTVPFSSLVQVPRGTYVSVEAWSNKPLVRYDVEQYIDDVITDSRLIIVPDVNYIDSQWEEEVIDALSEMRTALEEGDTPEPVDTVRLAVQSHADQIASSSTFQNDPIGGFLMEQFERIDRKLQSIDFEASEESQKTLAEVEFEIQRLARSFQCDQIGRIEQTQTIQISLTDTDGITGRNPVTLNLAPIEDSAPEVDVHMDGIGTAITAEAVIPLAGTVADQYGIGKLWFHGLPEGGDPARPVIQTIPYPDNPIPREISLRGSSAAKEEEETQSAIDAVFDVSALGLTPGRKLQIEMVAADLCDLPKKNVTTQEGDPTPASSVGNVSQDYLIQQLYSDSAVFANSLPNIGRSQRWSLDIVTPERLRIMLESKELALRQRFEIILSEVIDTRKLIDRIDFAGKSSQSGELEAENDVNIDDAIGETGDNTDSSTEAATEEENSETGDESADTEENDTADSADTADAEVDTADTPVEENSDDTTNIEEDATPEESSDQPLTPEEVEKQAALQRVRNAVRLQTALQNSQKNEHEIDSLARAFEGIRLQLVNNRLDAPEWNTRLTDRIIGPLQQIAEVDFRELEDRLRRLEQRIDSSEDAAVIHAEAMDKADEIILAMHEIMKSMLELEDYNEAIDLLRSIIKMEQELEAETKERDKQKLRDLLLDP